GRRRRQLAEQGARQRVVDHVGRQRLADRPPLVGLARRHAAIVLLRQARWAVTGGIVVAIVVVDRVAIAIGDGDVGRALSLSLAARLTLALSLTLTLSLARWTAALVGPVAVALCRRRHCKRQRGDEERQNGERLAHDNLPFSPQRTLRTLPHDGR